MLNPAMTARLDQSATSWARCGFGIGGWSSVPIRDPTQRPENLATVAGWVWSATLPSATGHPLVWAAGVHRPAAHATSGSARRSRSLHCRHRHPQGLRCAGDRGGPARRRLVVLLRVVRPPDLRVSECTNACGTSWALMAFFLLTQQFSPASGISYALVGSRWYSSCCTTVVREAPRRRGAPARTMPAGTKIGLRARVTSPSRTVSHLC